MSHPHPPGRVCIFQSGDRLVEEWEDKEDSSEAFQPVLRSVGKDWDATQHTQEEPPSIM